MSYWEATKEERERGRETERQAGVFFCGVWDCLWKKPVPTGCRQTWEAERERRDKYSPPISINHILLCNFTPTQTCMCAHRNTQGEVGTLVNGYVRKCQFARSSEWEAASPVHYKRSFSLSRVPCWRNFYRGVESAQFDSFSLTRLNVGQRLVPPLRSYPLHIWVLVMVKWIYTLHLTANRNFTS